MSLTRTAAWLVPGANAVFELCDAVLCADGQVRSVAESSLASKHRRGHGSGYAAQARGQIDIPRRRTTLCAAPLPRAGDGRHHLLVAPGSMVPGRSYSVIVALEAGRGSWVAPLDAVRLTQGRTPRR